MKPVLLAIGAVIIIILSPIVMTSINDFRTTDQQDVFNVTTDQPSANVTLSQELYNDKTYNVDSLSSNVSADAPLANSYTSATKVLTVSGLVGDTTHRLTIDYKIDATSEYPGAGMGASTLPLFLILGVIGIIVGAVYSSTRGD